MSYYGYVNGYNCGYHLYKDLDDVQYVQSGECDYCEADNCNGCFGYLGRGDGVLVLIKNNKCIKVIDTNDIIDYGFEES